MPYISLAVQSILWVSYGALIESSPVVLPSLIGTLLGIYYTYSFHTNYTRNEKFLLFKHYVAAGSVLLILGFCLSQEFDIAKRYIAIMSMSFSVVFAASPLVMILTVCRDKSVSALPFDMSLLVFINGFLWILFGILVQNDEAIYIPSILGLISGLLQIVCHMLYGNPIAQFKAMLQCENSVV